MRVFQSLQHLQLVIDHAFISLDVFLEDDLDSNLLPILRFRLADNAICSSAERASKLVQGPVDVLADVMIGVNEGAVLFLIALRLSRQLVDHVCD